MKTTVSTYKANTLKNLHENFVLLRIEMTGVVTEPRRMFAVHCLDHQDRVSRVYHVHNLAVNMFVQCQNFLRILDEHQEWAWEHHAALFDATLKPWHVFSTVDAKATLCQAPSLSSSRNS